ncbi:hypothetical protein [Endozoicomonas sp. 8E]|uniref:hypothetical protein n=1 Tax=Endozoicomonas sp. 8E TaxID=3035692 RepID=UPI0029392B6E|nr:hypothetical protein [Endozoicomonas sp. 8E]WOG27118.1 hypothetical protein P6910_21585 [Endozoicomonas sp. 8E]
MSALSRAQPWTGRFTVDLEQITESQKKNFFIKCDRRTLSGDPLDIIEKKVYSGSDFPPHDKRHTSFGYELKTTIIEFISWQWLYATNLVVAYELILTIKDMPFNSNPYSWLPVEVVVGSIIKSYWSPDSPLFNPIEQQSASMLKQGGQPFTTITTMFGSVNNPSQHPSSKSSCQQAPQANKKPTDYFTHFQYSDSGNGNQGPEQGSHTLGLNCFIHPCHGICQFRPASQSSGFAEWSLNPEQDSTDHTEAAPGQGSRPHLTDGHCLSCISDFDSSNAIDSRQIPPFDTLNDLPATEHHFDSCRRFQAYQPNDTEMPRIVSATADDLIIISGLLNLRKHNPLAETVTSFTITHLPSPVVTSETQQATGSSQPGQSLSQLSRTRTKQIKDRTGKRTCDTTIVGKNGQQRPCGRVCRNAKFLSFHKSRYHTGLKTCNVNVIGQDDQQRPCGKTCNDAKALADHKRRQHSGQETCHLTVVGQDGQPRPCGKICKNAQALSDHKRRHHSRQQTCHLTVVGEDGQRRPCGKVINNSQALTDHKRRHHSKQQTCDVTVIGQDGQQRPCRTICNNVQALSDHKRKQHSGQQTCDLTIVGQDGQPRPCGVVFKNFGSLSTHKSSIHRVQRTCHLIVVGDDGQLRQCGKVCKNSKVLSDHKRIHRKRKPACGGQYNDLSYREGKMGK